MQSDQISTAIASLANHSLQEAITKVGELGFESIGFLAAGGARHSIGDLPGFWFDELTREERERLHAAVVPYSRVGVHAPFMDAPLVSYSARVAATAKYLIRTGIEAAAFLGADVATAHVNSRPFFDVREYWEPLSQVLRELGDFGALLGVRIGVETGFPRDVDTYLRIIQEVDHPMVGATLDVGHVAFMVDQELWRTDAGVIQHNDHIHYLCQQLGSKLFHMHIHDVRKEDWRDHRMVGSGMIVWPELFACLNQQGYRGLLELELEEENCEEALLVSKARMQELL